MFKKPLWQTNVGPDQTVPKPKGAVCSGSTLFASILNSSVILGNYLQQITSADNIFRCIFFLGALRVRLLTPHHLEFLCFKGGCKGSSESTLVKMPHCWKSHVTAHIYVHMRFWYLSHC